MMYMLNSPGEIPDRLTEPVAEVEPRFIEVATPLAPH